MIRASQATMKDVAESLAKLDAHHRDELVVLALARDASLSNSAWQAQLRAAGIEDFAPKRGTSFTRFIELLSKQGALRGFFENDDDVRHAVSDAWMPVVLEDAVRRQRLEPIAQRLAPRSWSGSNLYGSTSLHAVGDMRRVMAQGDASSIARAFTMFSFTYPWSGGRAALASALG